MQRREHQGQRRQPNSCDRITSSGASTSATKPALSANSAMNSSGRLPSTDCSTPVAPGPKRSPNYSTERPTSAASKVTAKRRAEEGDDHPTTQITGDPGQHHGDGTASDDDPVGAIERGSRGDGHAVMVPADATAGGCQSWKEWRDQTVVRDLAAHVHNVKRQVNAKRSEHRARTGETKARGESALATVTVDVSNVGRHHLRE